MNKAQKDLRLLPPGFRIVSFVMIFCNVIFLILSFAGIVSIDKTTASDIFKTVLLISLLTLMLSNKRDEDELTIRMRLQAMSSAFLVGSLVLVIQPIIDFIIEGIFVIEKKDTHFHILLMLGLYFVFLDIIRKRMK